MTVSNVWTDPSVGGALDLTDGDTPNAAGYYDLLASDLLSLGGTKGLLPVCEGRLTLTSGTPVTTADVTGATTIYFTPYKGDRIALYSGTLWTTLTFTETSLALGTVTSGLPYDVFAYNNSGTLALEKLAWTNGTTRATALTTQNGILVKSGDTTRRYLGTFYTTSTTQTEDSAARRLLWNYYHRKPKKLYAIDTGDYTYTTATWRAANNNTTDGVGRFACVIGVSEDVVSVKKSANAENSNNAFHAIGIGIDSTSVNLADMSPGNMNELAERTALVTFYDSPLAVGYHYIQGLEYSVASGTTSWWGAGIGVNKSGMSGVILC